MNANQTKPVRRAAPAIGRAGSKVLADLAKKTRFVDPSLADNWPTIAGADIAALCRPGRLSGQRRERSLEVFAPSGAAASELQMRTEDLITRLNRFLGAGSVTQIVIRQTSAGPAPADDGDRSELGTALASFRAAIGRRNPGK